jgi:hypothetical protein
MQRTQHLLKKLRPGVLKKHLEGLPRPEVIDDIAGVKLGSLQSVSVSPRYVDYSTGLGPLIFHHLNYSSGARGPHRPIVLRKALRSATKLSEWHSQLERTIHQDAEAQGLARSNSPRWVSLPTTLSNGPTLAFAVGELACTEVLVAPPIVADPRAPPPAAMRGGAPFEPSSSAPSVAEPWRLGIGLDPFIRDTQRSVVCSVRGLGTQSVGPNEDTFFIPWEPVVFDVTVPEETVSMCIEANRDRANKQYAAGIRSRQELKQETSAAGFGLASREHSIRATFGDVVFLPSQFTFSLSRPVGYQTTSTTSQSSAGPHKTLSSSDSGIVDQNPEPQVVCVALKYKKYPRLSDSQAKLYIPADYTATRLEEFYRKGGNSLSPQYL